MSESGKTPVDTSRLLEEIGRSNAAPRPRRIQSRAQGGQAGAGRLLPTLLLLPLLAAVVWLALEQRQLGEQLAIVDQENRRLQLLHERTDARMEAFGDEISRQIRLRVAEFGPQAELDDDMVARLQSQLGRDVEQLSTMVAALQRQMASGQGRDIQLRYSEVDFLLRLAQRRLALEADTASAHLMFSEADGLLADIDSTLGNRLRGLLQRDMNRLADVNPVDLAQLYQHLTDLTAQLQSLSLLASRSEGHLAGLEQDWQQLAAGDQDVATAALALLRSIFVWRRPGEDSLPALPPQQEVVLRQNLRLLLEQAQLAVIMRDDLLLQASVQRATQWLQAHYNTAAPEVAEVQTGLQSLAEVSLQPALPDISESLALARQLSGATGN